MERVLTFKYPFEFAEEMKKLIKLFTEENVEFICHESDGYYPHVFVVRKSKRRWNELYQMINSVKAAKYEFKKANIETVDGRLTEVIYC